MNQLSTIIASLILAISPLQESPRHRPITAAVGGTFTLTQHVADRRVAADKLTCSGTGCTLTVPSTGTGHGYLAFAYSGGGFKINSVANGGTWTVPAACQASSGPVGQVSCAYVTSSSSGTTSIVFTFSGTVTSDDVSIFYWEVTWSGSSISFDACWVANAGTSSTTITGPTLSLAGGTEVVGTMASASGGTVTAASAPYDTNFVNLNDASAGVNPNGGSITGTTGSTAPTNTASSWTVSPAEFSITPACALKGN